MTKHEFFKPGSDLYTSTGIRSKIDLGTLNYQPAIRKTFETSPETLDELATAIPVYRMSLINAGLKIPDNYIVQTTDTALVLIDEHISGLNIDEMAQSMHPDLQKAWVDMIQQLCGANNGDHSQALIDTKPANFMINSDGVLYYVDLTPPMIRDSEGLITPWMPLVYKHDRRTATFLYGDTRGQITRLLSMCELSYNKETYENLKKLMLGVISASELPSEIKEYIEKQTQAGFPDLYRIYGVVR